VCPNAAAGTSSKGGRAIATGTAPRITGPDAPTASNGWRAQAACRGADPRDFTYPESAAQTWRPYCDHCPVAELCLWEALALEARSGYRYGIWGGCTPARRHRIAASLPAIDYDAAYHATVDAWNSNAAR
jgi:hypothetical protein